ncbi:MAG: tRNA pseudouridine(38-40) synthase TruA [Deltaproteobacteria bacterium]|nr:tRNA pseudouridine(38-40) synthase TruA [Deltaproteobacteria bacterium]
MPTWRLLLEYDGTLYVGWQRQPRGTSIQGRIEAALAQVLGGEAVVVHGSGRTDAGVHALGQVASFRATTVRSDRAIRMGLNSLLPRDIACRAAFRVSDAFDALSTPHSKRYAYRILDTGERSPLRERFTWHTRGVLDVPAMQAGARHLVGSWDFESFRAGGCSAATSLRTVRALEICRVDDEVRVEIEGDGFLRHMVRIVVGTLVQVGQGRIEPEAVARIRDARDRSLAGRTAPAAGLCLLWVDYAGADAPL